ncbi:MAG: type II toxin-antitoxin system HicA family toxin [Deltaproteobacteria bacterium]|nr:type II toxin-antitoxin system HicA family toxin [Deltaproteobacteria bacterium]
MPKLAPVSFSELSRKLRALGFEGPVGGGKHLFMVREDMRLTLPNPHRQDIGVDLLKRILRRGGIDRDEWIEA